MLSNALFYGVLIFWFSYRGSQENIKQYLTMRNFMQEMRDAGEITSGPKPFGSKDAQNFANSFNAFLQRNSF